MNLVLSLFTALLVVKLIAELTLDILNRREVLKSAHSVPEAFRESISEETYRKSVAYSLAKNQFSIFSSGYEAGVLAVLIFSGLLPLLWGLFEGFFGLSVWGQGAVLMAVFMVVSLPGLPLEAYSQFVIEERFGFNKSNLRLWIRDKLTGIALGLVLGYPLIVLILWFVGLAYWWLYAFATFLAFQLIMTVVYPMWIMPLYNKFEELEEGDLRQRLLHLGRRAGFRARSIRVMDGSKRSAHSNALFAGFGRWRRIVLFDTLIAQLNPLQLEAVLAHEIGHYKKGHIPRLFALSAVVLFVSFAILGYLAQAPEFVTAFGFEFRPDKLGPALLLFSLFSGLVGFWLQPIVNALSRHHEYEADSFARDMMGDDSTPLREALQILSEENLSNLTPSPTYSAFYYSHPTISERLRALSQN